MRPDMKSLLRGCALAVIAAGLLAGCGKKEAEAKDGKAPAAKSSVSANIRTNGVSSTW